MWYYTLNNQQVGPVDENEIKKLIAAGTINHQTMVWTTGMANWSPIGQSGLAPLLGAGGPPPVGAFPPMLVVEDPKVKLIKTLFLWFWISLAVGLTFFIVGTILSALFIGLFFMPIAAIGLGASGVLFFILIYKAWQLVQHEGMRANPDQTVAYCFIFPWNFYWFFHAFKGLAKEINDVLANEKINAMPMNMSLAQWFVISMLASFAGIGVLPFIVLWIMYTKKLTDCMIAINQARN
jgi:hypothetical protein